MSVRLQRKGHICDLFDRHNSNNLGRVRDEPEVLIETTCAIVIPIATQQSSTTAHRRQAEIPAKLRLE